jgi:phospholipid-binding lipoprotein MlaA
VGDIFLDPLFQVKDSATSWGLVITRFVDTRSGLLAAERVLDTAALDPYIFVREAYLQQRRNLVFDGNPPPSEFEEELFGDEFDTDPFDALDEEDEQPPLESDPSSKGSQEI